MKKLLTLFFFSCCTLGSFAQDTDAEKPLPVTVERRENKEVYFEKVFSAEGTAKEELYKRTAKWLTGNVKTSDVAFDNENKDFINATGNLVLENAGGPGISVTFKLSLSFKNDKVRMQCPSFTYNKIGGGTVYQHELGTITFGSANKKIYRSFDKAFEKVLSSFRAAVVANTIDKW